MALCTGVLIICTVFLFFKKQRFPIIWKKVFMIVAGAALFGIAADIYEKQSPILQKDNSVARYENGEGAYQADFILNIEDFNEEGAKEYGLQGNYKYSVVVPEQTLSRIEKEDFLAGAKKEIEMEFPGKNESVNCIRDKVTIRDTYQNGRVSADWTFSDYKIVDYEGNIIAEELPDEGMLVNAEVILACADAVCNYTFSFQVFEKELNEEEKFFNALEENLEMQETEDGVDILKLPKEIGGYVISWEEQKSYLPEKLLLMGFLFAAFIPVLEHRKECEEQKKRKMALDVEYPEMVSKLSLLLSAGMTVYGAWKKITGSYIEKRKIDTSLFKPVYEEMIITCHEIESGIGEEKAYERFGERCGQRRYRKLGNILTQNLKKGTKGLSAMLETEVDDAFEERKSMARKYGEEAGTKLLGPMVVMLGIVMFILIVPAVFSFQI